MASCIPTQFPAFLSEDQQQRLEEICRNGRPPAKKIRHVQVLLLSDPPDARTVQHSPQRPPAGRVWNLQPTAQQTRVVAAPSTPPAVRLTTMHEMIRDIIRRHAQPLSPRPTGHSAKLARLDGIRAVLFDIYGTLFISGSGDIGATQPQTADEKSLRLKRLAQEAFQATGLPMPPEHVDIPQLLTSTIREVHTQMRSDGIDYPEVDIVDVWRTVVAQLGEQQQWSPPPLTDRLLRQVAAEYEIRTNPVWPMPGAADCLRSLRDAGLQLGVVSNAQFYTLELFPALLGDDLTACGFDPQLRWFSYEQRWAKPGVELYRMARAELECRGIAAGETIFVGNDMLNDIAAAREVGFRTALFAGDQRSLRLRDGHPRVSSVQPDLVIDQLGQLAECLAD